MERAQLSAARHKKHWSMEEAAERLGVDKATVQRWEKGKSMPQGINLRKLCEVYEASAWELGLEAEFVAAQNATPPEQDDALAPFRRQDLTARLMCIVWNWPKHARYHKLQVQIALELEDNSRMSQDDLLSRRDTLRRLALLPIDMCALSALFAVFKRPVDEILAQCAAAIIACWYLRQGNELAFADDAISKYIPTLKEISRSGPAQYRKAATELLVQCLLLKTSLANHTEPVGSGAALSYAQQAEVYSQKAENLPLQAVAIRLQANAYDFAENWKQALEAGEKAKHLIETNKAAIPPYVASFIYVGLANYQSHNGQKQDALRSYGRAQTLFFADSSQSEEPAWFPFYHSQANLVLHDGLVHLYLGDFKEASDSFARARTFEQMLQTARVESYIDELLAELQREDGRDMDRCIDCWTQGLQGAVSLQSERWFNEARSAYTAMRVAWPTEKRIKALREDIVHW